MIYYLPINKLLANYIRIMFCFILAGLGNRGIFSKPRDGSLGYGGSTFDLESSVFGFSNSGRTKPNYFLTDHTDDIGYSPLPRYYNMCT